MPQETKMDESWIDSSLTEVFMEAASGYGYEDVTAEYAEFDELRLKWIRHGDWARFFVSDYLKEAPKEVMASIAETLMRKICCAGDAPYSEPVCDWPTGTGFVERNQPVYLRRKGGMVPAEEGVHKDLRASYDRLVSAGLLERDPSTFLAWDTDYDGPGAGRFSVLMRVVSVSSKLDDSSLSDEALDFALYSLALNIDLGFAPCRKKTEKEYAELFSAYPEAKRLAQELAQLGVSMRRCPPSANTPDHGPTMTPASGH